jgi:AraC family transcriptional regulator
MSGSARTLLGLMREISAVDDSDASLSALTARTGWSPSRLHKQFKLLAGETPKQFALRVRLERAALDLRGSEDSVLQIALAHGFESHEVFTRAFRRRFRCAPREYRAAVRSRAPQPGFLKSIAPCVGLYRVSLADKPEIKSMPAPTIVRKELETARPILFIQRRIPSTALQPTMAECFGALYAYGHKAGLSIAGHPMARYVSIGPGLWTVDFVMPLLTPAPGDGEMQAGFLPAGPVAFAVHEGLYDQLPVTNAAIEKWVEDNGYAVGGPPWEWYVTSPGEVPDPADWRTEIYWPLKG